MTPLEKAARAACDAYWGAGMYAKDMLRAEGPEWDKVARAVLMVVREPGGEAIDAGEEGYRDNAPDEHSRISPYAISKSFTAMIDALLNEEPK